jgi:HTH-type transcriptional regulator/antitoxin HigA
MKATLFVIENDVDHAQAKALVEKLMGSRDPADQARMTAQARLIEAYERVRCHAVRLHYRSYSLS